MYSWARANFHSTFSSFCTKKNLSNFLWWQERHVFCFINFKIIPEICVQLSFVSKFCLKSTHRTLKCGLRFCHSIYELGNVPFPCDTVRFIFLRLFSFIAELGFFLSAVCFCSRHISRSPLTQTHQGGNRLDENTEKSEFTATGHKVFCSLPVEWFTNYLQKIQLIFPVSNIWTEYAKHLQIYTGKNCTHG